MFIEIDVVEFTDVNVPYTTILLNAGTIRQAQPIDTNHRQSFKETRAQRLADKEDDPKVEVTGVEELPHGGGVLYLLSGGVYYTVEDWASVRDKLMNAMKATPSKDEPEGMGERVSNE